MYQSEGLKCTASNCYSNRENMQFHIKILQNTVLLNKIKGFYTENLFSPHKRKKTSENLSYCFKSQSIKITGCKAIFVQRTKPWFLHKVEIYQFNVYFTTFPTLVSVYRRNDAYFRSSLLQTSDSCRKRWLCSTSRRSKLLFFLQATSMRTIVLRQWCPTYLLLSQADGQVYPHLEKHNYSSIQLAELNV